MAQIFVNYQQNLNTQYRQTVADGDELVLLIEPTHCPKTVKVFPASAATISTSSSAESVIRAGTENRTVAATATTDDFADILYEAATAIIVSASGGSAEVEIIL